MSKSDSLGVYNSKLAKSDSLGVYNSEMAESDSLGVYNSEMANNLKRAKRALLMGGIEGNDGA